jgi:hypothetical protein
MSTAMVQVQEVNQNGSTVYVEAIVRDFPTSTYSFVDDADNYTDALCWAEFELSGDETLPEDPTELDIFIDDLDLEWVRVDNSADDLD